MNDFFYAANRTITATSLGLMNIEKMGDVNHFTYASFDGTDGSNTRKYMMNGYDFEYLEASYRGNVGCWKEHSDGFYDPYIEQFNNENKIVRELFNKHSNYFNQTLQQ